SSVKSFLKENLKNSSTYEPVSFSKLDTLEQADTSETKKNSLYKISHIYGITNSNNDKIKMTITFYLDKDFKVNETSTKSINGDYGTLTGNAYWKYNNYVGNKPDAGAEVTLYSLDTIRGDLKFEATADVQGNYKIDRIPPGEYFLIVRSKNATDCPESHLRNLRIYSAYFKQLFGFDLDKYKEQMQEIFKLDSLANAALTADEKGYGSASRALDGYYKYKEQSREKANELIKLFPDDFKWKIKLYTGYSNAFDFETIHIDEGKSANQITDFGITCI
ncbi:hypothetical protein CEN47_28750, partial [Fischerella thermalis CCMEE 5319]